MGARPRRSAVACVEGALQQCAPMRHAHPRSSVRTLRTLGGTVVTVVVGLTPPLLPSGGRLHHDGRRRDRLESEPGVQRHRLGVWGALVPLIVYVGVRNRLGGDRRKLPGLAVWASLWLFCLAVHGTVTRPAAVVPRTRHARRRRDLDPDRNRGIVGCGHTRTKEGDMSPIQLLAVFVTLLAAPASPPTTVRPVRVAADTIEVEVGSSLIGTRHMRPYTSRVEVRASRAARTSRSRRRGIPSPSTTPRACGWSAR